MGFTTTHFYAKQHLLLLNTAKNIKNEVLLFLISGSCNPKKYELHRHKFCLVLSQINERFFDIRNAVEDFESFTLIL